VQAVESTFSLRGVSHVAKVHSPIHQVSPVDDDNDPVNVAHAVGCTVVPRVPVPTRMGSDRVGVVQPYRCQKTEADQS